MTAKPMTMHMEHYIDNEKWRRAEWVKDHLRARPEVVEWTHDYWIDRFDTVDEMPFIIERINLTKRAKYDAQGKFMHMVALTNGERVLIRSLANPDFECDVEWLQGACIPACLGEYEYINQREGLCTVILIRWEKG